MQSKTWLSPLIAVSFILAASTTLAQSRGFAQIDTNANGQLSYSELVEAFGVAGANQLWRQNGERDISADDIRRINNDNDDRDDDLNDDLNDDRDDDRDDDGQDDSQDDNDNGSDDDSQDDRDDNGDDDRDGDNDNGSDDDNDDDGSDDDGSDDDNDND